MAIEPKIAGVIIPRRVFTQPGSFASEAPEAVRSCTSAAPPKADVNSTPWPPTLCADFVAEVTQQRPRLRSGCELGWLPLLRWKRWAGVIALTYQRKLQGGDLSLTRHMERLAVAGGRRGWPTCERVGRDQERIRPCFGHSRKGRVDIANGAGVQDIDLMPNTAGGFLNVTDLDFRGGIRWGRLSCRCTHHEQFKIEA
jgi:hypothetical protein